jgi:hypothetical protein
MRPEVFTPVHLDMAQLAQYYHLSLWNSTSVDFVTSRDNFTSPTPGLQFRDPDRIPKPETVFNMYWTEETIMRIVLETNRYARAPLPRKDNEAAQTKGGRKWKDVNAADIRGWLEICILMGCKSFLTSAITGNAVNSSFTAS